MALISIDYVKQNFDLWEDYCTLEEGDDAPDAVLQRKMDRAEEEFLEYLNVDDTTITAQQKRHLLNIIRKNCFEIKNGDRPFEHKPQIIRDYEESLKALEQYRKRIRGVGASGDIQITAKDREFDEWFTDPVTDADQAAS